MVLCVRAFSAVRWVQGGRSMATIAIIAVAAHGIVLATGHLYTAMAAHAVYDFVAGVLMMRLARRDDLLPSSPATTAEPAPVPGGPIQEARLGQDR